MYTIVGKENCPNCIKAKALCDNKGRKYRYLTVGSDITIKELFDMCGGPVKSVPQIFEGINSRHIGGYQDLIKELA